MSGSLPPKTLKESLKVLESCGHAKVREMNARNGAPDNQFGVKMGDLGRLRSRSRPIMISVSSSGGVEI